MYIAQRDRVADYRRQAENARVVARLISLNDKKHQLLEVAKHLDALAELEEREARKIAPVQEAEVRASFT